MPILDEVVTVCQGCFGPRERYLEVLDLGYGRETHEAIEALSEVGHWSGGEVASGASDIRQQMAHSLSLLQPADWVWLHQTSERSLGQLVRHGAAFTSDGAATDALLREIVKCPLPVFDRALRQSLGGIQRVLEDEFGESAVRNPSVSDLEEFAQAASHTFGRAAAVLLFIRVGKPSKRPPPASPLVKAHWQTIEDAIFRTESTATDQVSRGEEYVTGDADAPSPSGSTSGMGPPDTLGEPLVADPVDALGAPQPPSVVGPGGAFSHEDTSALEDAAARLDEQGGELEIAVAGLLRSLAGRERIGVDAVVADLAAYRESWAEIDKQMAKLDEEAPSSMGTLQDVRDRLQAIRVLRVEVEEASRRRSSVETVLASLAAEDVQHPLADGEIEAIYQIVGRGPEILVENPSAYDRVAEILSGGTLRRLLTEVDRSRLAEDELVRSPQDVTDDQENADLVAEVGAHLGESSTASETVRIATREADQHTAPEAQEVAESLRVDVGEGGGAPERQERIEVPSEGSTASESSATGRSPTISTTVDAEPDPYADRSPSVMPVAALEDPRGSHSASAKTSQDDQLRDLEVEMVARGSTALVGWLREAVAVAGGSRAVNDPISADRKAWHAAALAETAAIADSSVFDEVAGSVDALAHHPMEEDLARVLLTTDLRLALQRPFSRAADTREAFAEQASWDETSRLFVEALTSLAQQGGGIRPIDTSREASIREELESLGERARDLLDRAPRQKKAYQRASKVWHRLMERRQEASDSQLLAQALMVMAGEGDPHLTYDSVEFVSALESEDLDDLIDRVDTELLGPKRPKKTPIEARAHRQLMDSMQEVVELAQQHVVSTRDLAAITAQDQVAHIDKLRRRVLHCASDVVELRQGTPSAQLLWNFARWVKAGGHRSADVAPSAETVLYGDVVQVEGFAISGNGSVLRLPSAEQFEEFLSRASGDAPDTQSAICEELIRRGRLIEARILLASLDDREDPRHTASLAARLDSAVGKLTDRSWERIADCRALIESLRAWNLAEEEGLIDARNRSDQIELLQRELGEEAAPDLAKIVDVDDQLSRLRLDLEDRVELVREDLTDQLRSSDADQSVIQQVTDALAEGRFASAIASMVRITTSEAGATYSVDTSDWARQFMDAIAEAQPDESPGASAAMLGREGLRVWTILGRDLDIRREDSDGFRKMLISLLKPFGWIPLVRERERKTQKSALAESRKWEVPVTSLSLKGLPRLDVKKLNVIFHRPVGRAALAIVDLCRLPEAPDEATLVFYTGRLNQEDRRLLARELRPAGSSAVVVDLNLLDFIEEHKLRPREALSIGMSFSAGNPYSPFARGSISNEMFYGRDAELQRLVGANENFFLSGGRQMGKSALLRRVMAEFNDPPNHHAVYVDVDGAEAGGHRSRQIWAALLQRLPVDILRGGDDSDASAATFREVVMRWLEEDPARRLLVLMDEADSFLQNQNRANVDAAELKAFRELNEQSNHRFRMVFAGTQKVHRFGASNNNAMGHMGSAITVRPLEPLGAGLQLIREPPALLGIEVEEQAAWQAFAITNGHPGLIQLLMRHLLDDSLAKVVRVGEPPYTITEADVSRLFSTKEDLRRDLQQRFELTITLEPRYRVISYLLAKRDLDRLPPFTLAELKLELDGRSPDGFLGLDDEDFEVLIDELVDLGVARKMPIGEDLGVRLASPSIRSLLGNRKRIESQLQAAQDEDFEPALETEARPVFAGELIGIRQPDIDHLTNPLGPKGRHADGEKIIWFLGSTALGVRSLSGHIEKTVVDLRASRGDRDEVRVHPVFVKDLKAHLAEKGGQVKSLILLDPRDSSLEDLAAAANRLDGWVSETRRAAVILDETRPDLWHHVSSLPASRHEQIVLSPWDEPALKAKRSQDCAWLDTRKQRQEIITISGGWPEFLKPVLNDRFRKATWARKVVDDSSRPSWAQSFLKQCGLRDRQPLIDLIKANLLAGQEEMKDPEWRPELWLEEDLIGLGEGPEWLEELSMLGVIVRDQYSDEQGAFVQFNAPVMRAIGAVRDELA